MGADLSAKEQFKSKKLVFWDFDGVIKDSVNIKTEAFVSLFRPFGAEVADKVKLHHEANGGMSRYDKFPLYLQWAGLSVSDDLIQTYSKKFKDLVFSSVISCDWVEGAEAFIRTNKYNQIFILVSATPQDELLLILEELKLSDHFFDKFGSPRSKTSAIASVLNQLQINQNDAIMIGDAKADQEAADNNGVEFLLRLNSSNKALFSEFEGLYINNFTEL